MAEEIANYLTIYLPLLTFIRPTKLASSMSGSSNLQNPKAPKKFILLTKNISATQKKSRSLVLDK